MPWGHRGLRPLHRNTNFTMLCRYLQTNRDKTYCIRGEISGSSGFANSIPGFLGQDMGGIAENLRFWDD
jgi:hypothetical protein